MTKNQNSYSFTFAVLSALDKVLGLDMLKSIHVFIFVLEKITQTKVILIGQIDITLERKGLRL